MRQVVGVIGHVDHGKTALVRALTGMETDHLEEEKRRGISIVLGFAHLKITGAAGETIIDLVDMPGHERFVRTMVAGATGMQAALLVVAANEGLKPQTIEHLDIVALLGVRHLIIAVSKADLTPACDADLVAGQAAELAAQRGLGIIASLVTSAVSGAGIAALRAALTDVAEMARTQDDDGLPYLPIDRVFTMQGHGTVVTGTLRRGKLAIADDIALYPGNIPVRIRGLQVHGERVVTAVPNQRVAVNLRDLELGAVGRGAALCHRDILAESIWLSVSLRAVASAPDLATTSRVMLLFGTEEVEARVRLLDRDVLRAGEHTVAQLKCTVPVSVPSRERFILRFPSPPRTIAGGRVIDPAAVRLRRNVPGVVANLADRVDASPADIIHGELRQVGAFGVTVARLAQLGGVAPSRVLPLCEPLKVFLVHGNIALLQTSFDRVTEAIPRNLEPQAEGLPRDHVAALMKWAGAPVVDDAISALVRDGVLLSEAGMVRLRNAERENTRASGESLEAGRVAELLLQAGLSPPAPETLAPGANGRRLTNILVHNGVAVRVPDKINKRELLFHADAIESAKLLLTPLLSAPPGLLVSEAGATLGISRKYSMPLLEYFDTIRFTRRIADRRMLARVV